MDARARDALAPVNTIHSAIRHRARVMSSYGARPTEDQGLLHTERKRKAIPLALQGAVVMAFGLTIAYLMYRLTSDADEDADGNTIELVRSPGF